MRTRPVSVTTGHYGLCDTSCLRQPTNKIWPAPLAGVETLKLLARARIRTDDTAGHSQSRPSGEQLSVNTITIDPMGVMKRRAD